MTAAATIPFDASTTALEVLADVDLRGKRALVTGAGSGLGAETARALAASGAQVTLAVRDPKRAADVVDSIVAAHPAANLSVAQLDLADIDSVDALVAQWEGPLHILVNNAGIMAHPEARTPQGWELHFATNHLGHLRLSLGLHGALRDASGARVVSVSSVGHVNAEIDFDDIHFENRPYDAFTAYGQSKTANALFAVEGARRWANDGIVVNTLNPGRILSTNLIRYMGTMAAAPASFDPTSTDVSYKNAEQGAATATLLAGSPYVEGISGVYFEDCQPAVPYQPGVRRGVATWATDPAVAERLWDASEQMLRSA